MPDKIKRKISEANKGKIPWNKGKTYSEDIRKRISEGHKGQIPWNKTLPAIPDLCKCGCNEIVWDGHIYIQGHNSRVNNPSNDPAVRLKISKNRTGISTCLKGRKYSEEHCRAISESRLKYRDVLTKDFLHEEYIIKRRRTKDIAKDVGCQPTTIIRYIHRYNIPVDHSIFTRYGSDNSMYGKHFNHTEEVKKKISNASSERWGNPTYRDRLVKQMRKRWSDPEYKNRLIKLLRKSNQVKPTRPEQRVLKVISDYNIPYKYTGDGSFIIYGLNPDFTNSNGQKKVIEIFGDYWHRDDVVNTWKATEFGRKAVFSQLGYKLLVIWESEINSMNDDEIAKIIKEFDKEN